MRPTTKNTKTIKMFFSTF